MSDNTLHQTLLPAFEEAQTATIQLMRAVVQGVQQGMTPRDVQALAESKASENPIFNGWFHRPEVFFNRSGPRRTSSQQTLAPGVVVQIDLAPATAQAFGDFGYGFTFDAPEHTAVHEARRICRATCGFASRFKCVGELFVFAQSWANNHRLQLGARHHIGHACLPREGLTQSAWPLGAKLAIQLRRNQIQWYNPRRMSGVYAVNPPIITDNHCVAFEEMIFIDGDQKRVLGRNNFDEIGTL